MRLLSLLWIGLLLCTIHLSAQTTWTGATDTNWFNVTNWSAGLPSSTNGIATIPSTPSGAGGFFPTIASPTTIDYDVDNFGQLTIGSMVTLQNRFQNFGASGLVVINSAGNFVVDDGAIFFNYSTVENNNIVENNGAIITSSQFTNLGTFTNNNNYTNGAGSSFDNGSATQAGIVINNGNFESGGTFNNTNGAVVNNTSFNVQSTGTIVNEAEIKNNANFYFAGGSITNNGSFINCDLLTNDFGATFSNNGTLINTSCSIVNHFTSNVITGGAVVNNGIVYRFGSDVTVTSGTGVKFVNPFTDFPAPTANCFDTITIQLDQVSNTITNISPSDLDSASAAPYCGIETLAISEGVFDCSDLGSNTVTLTVTDSLGNSTTCNTEVIVTDNEAPVITFCPSNQTIDLGPGLCGAVATFDDVLSTDNCNNPTILKLDSTDLVSGSFFPVGVNNMIYIATDGFLADTCRFSVTINEFQAYSSTLSCQSFGQLSIDLDCESELHSSMLLLGSYGCYDIFETFIKSTGETTITPTHVGQTITVMVRDPRTGNSCWGELYVEDKGGPAIFSCEKDTVYCVENPLPHIEGGDVVAPSFQDCQDVHIVYYDDVENFNCSNNFTKKINRNWLATDDNGNTSSCVQEIMIRTVDLTTVAPVCPPDFLEECVFGRTYDLHPTNTGYPTIAVSGKTFSLDNTADFICNIKATFRDDTLATSCGASINIVRTWKIIDCCASNTILWSCNQLVKLTDSTNPLVKTPTLFDAVVDNNTSCTSRPTLPRALVNDCSPYSVLIMTPSGIINGNGGQVPAPGLKQGVNIVTYLVTDECGNSSTMDMTVIVKDERPPVPVCKRWTTVAVTSSGTGVLQAESLDEGSNDECCLDPENAFLIRRMEDACMMPLDTTFQPEILLCCADAMDTLIVEMQVSDCAGNTNTCIVNVIVDNNLPPVITCPPTATIRCDQNPTQTSRTGNVVTNPNRQRAIDGFATDNCSSITVDYMDDNSDVSCASGFIVRTWKATDMSGTTSTCNQNIHIQNNDPFDGDADIIWPNDTSIIGCTVFPDTSVTGAPILLTDGCDMVSMTFRDDTLRSSLGDQVKILREWVVIDECQYTLNDPTNTGLWDYTQVIQLEDPDAPTITGCNSKIFCNENNRCQNLTVDLSIEVDDTCTPADNLMVNWIVDANADGVPDSGPAFAGSGMNDNNAYPNGTHEICYEVIDGFNNRTSCCFLFKIIDCKKPTAICQDNSISLMATGMVPANIMLFENGSSSDNCTAREDLKFSYSSDVNDTVRVFTCMNIGINPIEVWVTDELGNQQFCNARLDVQDNMGACAAVTKVALGGSTKNDEGEAVSDVQMTISGQGSATISTDDAGEYMFTNIPAGHDYSLTPFKNDDLRNGVSTIDIVLISKHVLNVAKLDSPYKLIAADVNNSGSISTLDVVAIRKAVLFVSDEFVGNTSWRFIDKNHTFTNPANPFNEPFAEVVNMNNLTHDELKADFMAVKIGDVNGDAIPNGLLGVDDRTFNETLNLTLHNQTFEKGDFITVTFQLEENESLAGLQSTINFDPSVLDLVEVVDDGVINRQNLGLTLLQHGAITLSWDNAINQTLLHEQSLFSLQFQTLAAGKLSEWLSLSSNYTTAEAYAADGSIYNLDLKFNDDSSNKDLVLYQNKPNPFADATVVGFDLPTASNVSLTIYDLSGKVVNKQDAFYRAGYNEFKVEKGMLNASGVLYYRLDTPSGSATRKMILLSNDK